ncbi:MAG: hypothetical protein CK427_16925 [Leptospira sp.]|nr:MAG: hypothetical protein CK427_16925 [Leptospira sp.]
MIRTLTHLGDIFLWPQNTVIIIDEFENSLGVNCLDVVTENIITEQDKLQFILTSHHPYIINNININNWKIVTRKGGKVSTHNASKFNLGSSNHEGFIKLINLLEDQI